MGLGAHLVKIQGLVFGLKRVLLCGHFYLHFFFSGDKPGNLHDKGTKGLGTKNEPF